MKPLLIGIAGGTASGKSSIARVIAKELAQQTDVLLFKMDDYYKDQSHLNMAQRIMTNYDHPNAFDFDLMLTHIKTLINGCEIQKPLYDYTIHTRKEIFEVVQPQPIIIIEGLFALFYESLLDIYDLKVFVDTDADIRLIRRLMRDVKERGRTLESVIDQYENVVKPMHEQFIEPSKRNADLIIPRGKENYKAIDLIITKICSIL